MQLISAQQITVTQSALLLKHIRRVISTASAILASGTRIFVRDRALSGRERRVRLHPRTEWCLTRDNVDFFGNQASGFIGAIHSLLSSATCNIGNDIFTFCCRVARSLYIHFLRGAAGGATVKISFFVFKQFDDPAAMPTSVKVRWHQPPPW